jgi:hypothetical protein
MDEQVAAVDERILIRDRIAHRGDEDQREDQGAQGKGDQQDLEENPPSACRVSDHAERTSY